MKKRTATFKDNFFPSTLEARSKPFMFCDTAAPQGRTINSLKFSSLLS